MDKLYAPRKSSGASTSVGKQTAGSRPAATGRRTASSSRRPTSPARCTWGTRSSTRSWTRSCAITACAATTRSGCRAPTMPASPPRWWSSGSSKPRAEPRTTSAARNSSRSVWAMEGAVRRHHHAADAPPGRLGGLVARALHHGRRALAGGDRGLRRLHEQGLIYRGKRLVNWDPVLLTALSDLEVQTRGGRGTAVALRAIRSTRRRRRTSWSRPRAPRPCSATPRWRCIPTTSATGTSSARRCACRSPTGDIPIIADELRRPDVRLGLRQDHPGARLQRLRDRPAPRPPADQYLHAAMRSSTRTCRQRYRGLDRFDARKRVVADARGEGLLEQIDRTS